MFFLTASIVFYAYAGFGMAVLVAIVVVGALSFGFNFVRRFSTARIGIAVEARLRGLLYDAYLRYPRAFYDRHATGEVISRAPNDIYPVRYFIGWGVIQAIQSAMMTPLLVACMRSSPESDWLERTALARPRRRTHTSGPQKAIEAVTPYILGSAQTSRMTPRPLDTSKDWLL